MVFFITTQNQYVMRTYALWMIFLLVGISLGSCERENPEIEVTQEETLNDSIQNAWYLAMVETANDLTQTLNGQWAIDSVEIEFRNTPTNAQAGILADTVLVDFGQVNFGLWQPVNSVYPEATSYSNESTLIFGNEVLTVQFDYFLHLPGEDIVFSFLSKVVRQENSTWDTPEGKLLCNLGILDNIEIVKLNENEFHLIGLNQGVRRIKLRRL